MTLRLAPLLTLLLLPLFVGFSSKPKFTISFHAQADEMDPKKTMFDMQIEGRPMKFKAVPEASQQNIAAFHPFDSDTGDKGVALQLDFRGRGSLEMVTRTRQGQYLLAMVNGKPVDYVIIDQVIDSGLITVWRGITDEIIKQMDKKYPRIKPDGSAHSMSENMEMSPTTKKEKKEALKDAKEEARAAEKARKAGKPEKEEIPNLEAPRAPVTNKIPVEGAAPQSPAPPPASPTPPPATPGAEPPLPLPKP